MEIRQAKTGDAEAIHSLITYYAQRDKMLFLSMADIFENLQRFVVAQVGGTVVGCCALGVFWSDLGEVKSLAVGEDYKGKGAGKRLVEAILERAAQLGISRVFTLTLEPGFFEKLGFEPANKDSLPMKVWSECAKCSKKDNCDEIAMIYTIK
jgi:amino-acid N-acetyltransferase